MAGLRAIDRVKVAMTDSESRPALEQQSEYKRLISWGNPRVWLRELIAAALTWLNKPTKAEAAHVEAAYLELHRLVLGEQVRHSAVCAMEGDAAACPCQRPISSDSSSCDPGLGAH